MENIFSKNIIRALDSITASGNEPYQIFDDFLEITECALNELPGHLKSVKAGKPLEDSPETLKVWERMNYRYDHKEYVWNSFSAAFAALIDSVFEWEDVLGTVFMEWGMSNKRNGQFFTPWDLCVICAEMSMKDIVPEIHKRIKTAINKDPFAQATLIAGLMCKTSEEATDWFLNHLLPAAAPYVDPIKISDCCCGSGGMLLAAASLVPSWALDWGIVQFYGQDIDLTCVRMAKINMMIHGLNGYSIRCAAALAGPDVSSKAPGIELRQSALFEMGNGNAPKSRAKRHRGSKAPDTPIPKMLPTINNS